MVNGTVGQTKTSKLVMTAMTMCLIIVAIFIMRIPIPGTQGYVNLSDAVIFLGIFVLGWKYGCVAAAVGSALGDLLGGFPAWAPWTVFIKGGMAVIAGLIIAAAFRNTKLRGKGLMTVEILAMIAGGMFMVLGYFIAEGVMYGNWAAAALGIPFNIIQFAVGIVLALLLSAALRKTSFRKFFTYNKLSQK